MKITDQLVSGLFERKDLVKASSLEEQGWRVWLTTLFPFVFTDNFSKDHVKYWDHKWRVFGKLKRKEEVTPDELATLIVLGRGMGKCLAYDTDVLMGDGTRKRICDIAIGDRVVSYDADGKSVIDAVTRKWDSGAQEVYRITTRSGKVLDLTPQHQLWTINGWRELRHIAVGDRIAVPRRTEVAPTECARSDEEVTLLAYMLAEGGTGSYNLKSDGKPNISCSASFTNADPVIVSNFVQCCESMGFTVAPKGRSKYGYSLRGGQQWLRDVEMSGKLAHEKHIPDWVFRLPDAQRWVFLAGMFDTDGYICADEIGIALSSKSLIDGLSYLLSSVGVISTVRFKRNNKRGAWVLRIDKRGFARCAERMPLLLKADKLQNTANKRRRYSLLDVYPYMVARNLPKGVGYWVQRQGLSISHRSDITREKLSRAYEMYPLPQWKWLEDADVFWDKVTNIELCGTTQTFDIETQTHHNFVANGIVSHNSTMSEASALMQAALLGELYLLYVCGTDDQAREHIGNVKFLIEHPDSKIAEYYPGLAEPQEKRFGGGSDTWNKDTFITRSGAIFRAKGLNSSMRGLRVGTMRPTLIILDDIDDIKHSIAVAQSYLNIIKASILPVAADNTLIDFPQNLISEHSVMNQIYVGVSDALSDRTCIGVTKAFEVLDIETKMDEATGRIRHTIQQTSVPSWVGFDIKKAQKFLNASGLNTFLAEYQNELDRYKSGKVIPEYNEAVQLITWSEFAAVFGERHIPSHWRVRVGLDVGYSDGQYPHYSAWTFFATSAQNSPLPNKVFLYRARGFKGTSIDDQAETIKSEMYGERVETWQMSHERTGEMLTLRQKHELPFVKFQYYKAEDGVAQWRHLSRPDKMTPHPFKDDTQSEDGTWVLGCPSLFYVVDDDQAVMPRDDAGMRLFRQQISSWEYVPVKLTETGMTAQKPSKIDDDFCDSAKSILALFGPGMARLTDEEKIAMEMPESLHKPESSQQMMAKVMLMEKRKQALAKKRESNVAFDSWR